MISSFRDKYYWLSNFSPAEVTLDGETYCTIEHAYQASKLTPSERWRFHFIDAGSAKRLGKKGRVLSRSEKLDIMWNLIQQKFAVGTSASKRLMATGGEQIVEGNWWGDRFWGTCDGVGENNLGKLIMKQREYLFRIHEEL